MTQTIEQLQAKVAELEEENARLKSLATTKGAMGLLADQLKQLAASQAYAEQLRVALQTFIDEHEECQDADDWMAMMCSIEAHHVADEDLSTPPSTTALQSLITEVERRTIERCAKELCRLDYWYSAHAIRALPTGNLNLDSLRG